jgi:hypothetical protein
MHGIRYTSRNRTRLRKQNKKKAGDGPALRFLFEHEPAVFVEQLTVHKNFGVGAHITDEVPVDGALVFLARFGISRAKCHVERTTDLFIEQDLSRELVDIKVGADGKLANVARAGIRLDHFQQVILVLCS